MANEQILQDPNYLNANKVTQEAIRESYGITDVSKACSHISLPLKNSVRL
jgi:hypothetical protein